MKMKWLQLMAVVSSLAVANCGGRNSGSSNGDSDGGDSVASTCTRNEDCRSGICEGGFCAEATVCKKHSDCNAGQYCHFPSAPNPWVTNTEGSCSGACTNDASCGIVGQTCVSGRCYTNLDCNPASNSSDCPPGEVCNQQSRTCGAPPSTCYFNEQCPANWQCNTDHKCIDPDNLATCTTNANCDGTTGCPTGACECFDGSCRVAGSCSPATEYTSQSCGSGKYCAGNRCQTATACAIDSTHPTGHEWCLPYGLVCKNNFCINPPPCGANNSCTTYGTDWNCHTNTTPATCSPGNECYQNSQCPTGKYCDTVLGQCKDGCRDNADCQASCPGSSVMCGGTCSTDTGCDYCQSNHTCGTTQGAGACAATSECGGGEVCVSVDPNTALECAMGVGMNCALSCHQTCDLIFDRIIPMCADGEKCGGDSIMNALLNQALGALISGTKPTASVCYPETTSNP